LPILLAILSIGYVLCQNQKQTDFHRWYQTHPSPGCPPDAEGFISDSLIASSNLKKFFIEYNATKLAKVAGPLIKNPPVGENDWKAIEYIILERSDYDLQAMSNLLMYPQFMTDKTKVRTILIGLSSSIM